MSVRRSLGLCGVSSETDHLGGRLLFVNYDQVVDLVVDINEYALISSEHETIPEKAQG